GRGASRRCIGEASSGGGTSSTDAGGGALLARAGFAADAACLGGSGAGRGFGALAAVRLAPILRGSPRTVTEPPAFSIASRALALKAWASTVSLRLRRPVPKI